MLITGHYLKRPKPISYPYADVLLAKYRACARGQVLELQRVTNQCKKSDSRKIEYSPTEPKAGAGPGLGMPVKDLARKTISAEAG